MNGIQELLKKYGTSLAETRKLMPELTEAIKQERVMKPPALPSVPQFFTAEEAMQFGMELEPGWRLKVTPPVDGQEPKISYVTPEEWEITQAEEYISPEGQKFTRSEFEAFFAPSQLLYKEYQRTGGELDIESWAMIGAPLHPGLGIEQVFGKVFPERDVMETLAYAEAQPEVFLKDILDIGRTPETENLLRAMYRITPEQLEQLFAPPAPEVLEIPEEGIDFMLTVEEKGVEVRKLATLLPDNSVWVSGENIGRYDPATEQITPLAVADITEAAWQTWGETPWGAGVAPWDEAVSGFPGPIDLLRWIAPTKAGRALGLVGSYWQKYISRPWETFILETRITCQTFYGLDTDADRWAQARIDEARDKYGWAMYFSPEVSNIYEAYVKESWLPVEIALRVSEWCHPVYWLPVGKGAGVVARYTSRIPVIGKITARTAAAVTKAEMAIAYPITKPMELAYRKTFGAAIKSSLRQWGASRGVTFPSATQNQVSNIILSRVSPDKLTGMVIKDLFTKSGGATAAAQAAASYAEKQAVKYFPLLTASSQAVTGAAPATSTAIVAVTEKIISANIPSASITAGLVASFVPKGITLEKTVSLTTQLGEMGFAKDAIAAMSTEEAWANLFKTAAPEVTVPPPKVPGVDISGMTDGEAAKIIAASDHLLMEIPSQAEIINSALQSNWGKTIAQEIGKIPAGKELVKLIDPRELVSMDAATIEAIVARNAIGFSEVVKMGQNAAAVKMGELQGITINPVKMFGFNKDAYSAKMISRLLPDYKGIAEAGTLEHVFTHPEMYSWERFDKGLRYVTTVHEINTEVFNLLKKEGVAPTLSEEAMREWWIHRVVEGRYDADGELIAIRGRPGMRGVTAAKRGYEMHRKAPTMYEGMSWHIKYAENPEVSVRTYIEDAFIKMAQERFYQGTDTALEAIGKAGVKPSDVLKELYPDIIGRFELAADELKAAANFHSVINRAIRGERTPEQTLSAIERRFPELGKRFRSVVKEPVVADTQLRAILAQNDKLIRSLRAKLEKAEAIDIEAIKAEARTEAVRTGIPDEQKLVEAFRIMDYEDRLAFRSTMESQMEDIGLMLAEEETELAGVLEFLKTDPVATYHGTVRGKRVPLTSVLVKGQFPESFTVKEATMLMMGRTPKTIIKGRVPRSVVVDELADHFKMSEQQLIDHIESIAEQRVTAKDLRSLLTFGSNREQGIKRMLEILDRVDTAPEFILKVEPAIQAEMVAPEAVTPEVTKPILEVIQRETSGRPMTGKITIGDKQFFFDRTTKTVGLRTGRGNYVLYEQTPTERLLIADEVKTQGELIELAQKRVAIPKAEPGMPEAGLQKDMFGYETPHFPRGKGVVTQISMDDYNKLVEYHKKQGLPPPNVGVKPVVEGIKGLEEVPEVPIVPVEQVTGKYYRFDKRETIGEKQVRFYSNDRLYAEQYQIVMQERGWKGEIVEESLELNNPLIVNATERQFADENFERPYIERAIKEGYDAVVFRSGEDEFVAKISRPVVKPPAVQAQFKQVTYEAPPVKSVAERKAALDALRKEVKILTEAKKVPYWKARAERAAKMELVRQPPIGEGFIMQSHFSGKIYDQEFIDAVNAFFGHKSGLNILKPIADLSGILTTAKAALDVSFPAIQGMPAFGLAHSYFLTNPKIGAKLLGAWFKAFAYPVRAYLQPEWMHRMLAKSEADALQRISFGGSSMSIDYFRALRQKGGLGGFAAEIMHKIPFAPYERAELAFYGAGEIIRNEFWNILKGDAIKQGAEFNLAQSLDRMTGLISSEKMGITLTQRQLERSFMFFAPQYTRACLTFLGNVFRGGYTGAHARRSLGGLIAAGAIYYAAVQYAIATLEGKDHDDAWDTVSEGFGLVKDPITGEVEWKPTARFMSIKVGNYNFGVGGFWYGLVRLAGNISACINEVGEKERIDLVRILKDGSFNKRDNPFIYWWWSRSSMVTHAIAELGTGTDFLGYPIETPWEYSRHLISMLQPIWMEQGVNWMIPGMARDNEIPEGAARAAIIPAELFGLRTFPEGQWVRFYDKATEYIKHIPEDELDEKQIEAWRDGKLEWRHLTDIQQMNLLSRYPELNELYTGAQADSAVRDSDKWKQWQGRTDEERTVYYDRGGDLVNRLITGDIDSREFREMWSEAGQNYGIALDTIEKEPTYSEIYDYFEKAQSERGEEYGFLDDLALGEYVGIIFTDYLDDKGDYDWDAKDRAVDEYIEKWGEETYERIRQMYADKKVLAGLSPALIRLSDDKDKLGREYWQLPYKPIKEMDADDELEGNIPAEYYTLWKQYQALETDAQRDAFIESNPLLAKDWRAEYRKDNPEDDARLALWGYGGKVQSMEAYNLVTKWGQELGIPLEQMGLGLPPRSLIDQYFEHAEIVKQTSGSSVDARLYKLEHPGWLDWGVENWGWGDLSDDNINALRLRVEHKDLFAQYEGYGVRQSELYIEDDKAREKARDKLLEANPIFRDDRIRVEAYQLEFPDDQVETFVEYSNLPVKGFEQERYLLEHPEFYKSMIDLKDMVPFDPGYKVPAVQYDQIYHKWEDLFEQYETVTGTVSQRKVAREKMLSANPEFAFDRQRREAYGKFVPEHLVDTYAEWFTTKPQRSDDPWFEEHPTQTYYGDDWWLMDRMEFYDTMVAMGLWEERDFSKVPTKEVFNLYKTYLGIPKGAPQLNYRARHLDLDAWGVLKLGWIPIAERGKKEPPKTPWEEAEEAERFKELF